MSEPEKVRLVRCPKCENLLPELADYSVYQCGGCGAVLRAKNKNIEADTLSQKSDEDRVQGVSGKYSEKSDNFNVNEKRVNLSDGGENDVKSNGSSSRRADNREVLCKKSENLRNYSYIEADKWVVNNDLEMNEKLDESGHSEMGKEFEKLKPPNGTANGPRRSGQVADWRSGEGGETEGFWRNPRRDVEGMRYASSKYSEEGPSNYCLRTSYGYREPLKKQNKPSELDKVEELEQNRAELLRKLDELKDQLSRSCDVNDKSKENVPLNGGLVCQEEPYGNSETWFPDDPWGSNRASVQYFMPDAYVAKPPYVSHHVKPSPYYMNGHEMDMHRFYPPLHNPNQVQRFGVPSSSQMLRRAPHQAPGPLQQQPSHPYFSRPFMHDDMDPFEPYPPNIDFHQPSCSCFHCYTERSRAHAPPPHPHPAFRNKMYPDVPNKSMFYHHGNPSAFCQRDYNLDVANPLPLNSHNHQSHTRWPTDLKSEVGDHVRHRPPRVVLATGGRRCRPVAGGAPFVTCYNCFELLQLPKKIFLEEKIQNKIRCGSCSTFILFVVVNKKLVVSVPPETVKTLKTVDDSPNNNITMSGCTLHSHGHANQAGMNFSSDDYDNSGYDFQSMDREVISTSTGQGFYSSKSAEMRSLHSTSPYSSEDENITESLHTQGDESNSAELEAKVNLSALPAGSPLEDHFDHSNKYHAVNRFGNGSQSGRSEREKGEPKKATSRQNSMKDASLATEMEVSFNEYSNTGISQESGDANREDDQPRVTKGGQSFFAGIIKKSFKDFSRSSQTIERSTSNVTINGHPIPDRLLKKAEKLAGPIHPGQYWYDFRGGFWGVMGGPCLGIIPPFIEEFNHPMPEKCAGGNTGVFVNGRELHQKDLNLLGSRGLPTTKDRSYVIEISGRVLDGDSGEELDSLGKLAPTVEKLKHGFGMKVPRVAAQVDQC